MPGKKIFIVEDDKFYGELLRHHLGLNPENELELYTTGKDCLNNLHRKPNIITLDFSLPDMDGQTILKRIKQQCPETEVIIISGQDDVKTAIHLLKEGAYDYLVKDEETKERLWNAINRIRDNQSLQKQVESLQEEVVQKYNFAKTIIGNSPSIKKIFSLLEKASQSNIVVSITGETGTGKEVAAKAIHFNSGRQKKQFIAVNVAAIPKELIESELFGYEKGAFTGAQSRRAGKFEEADKGTIFLDEIGDMELNMQAKLLRVLQEKEFSRIGGNEVIKSDFRLIVATHKNLANEVKEGRFREDLYYRLLGLQIELPPLRERGNDIALLAKHFVETYCKENKIPGLKLDPEAIEKMGKHSFPGNIRELKSVMDLACVMADGGVIREKDIIFQMGNRITDLFNKETTLEEYNQLIIKNYLEKYNNNVLLVAKKLNIGKSTIYRMIQNKSL